MSGTHEDPIVLSDSESDSISLNSSDTSDVSEEEELPDWLMSELMDFSNDGSDDEDPLPFPEPLPGPLPMSTAAPSDNECVICWGEQAVWAGSTCCHSVFCDKCYEEAKTMETCPLCREEQNDLGDGNYVRVIRD